MHRAHETVLDPCLPKELVDEQIFNSTKFKITGTGEFSRCTNLLASKIEQSSNICKKSPCSLDGVYQAPIDYQRSEFYGFAEFWYSSNDVLNVGGKYSYDSLQNAAQVKHDTLLIILFLALLFMDYILCYDHERMLANSSQGIL